MTAQTKFSNTRIFVVDAAHRAELNSALAPDLGPDVFSVPLVNDKGAVTHYGCSGHFNDWQLALIKRHVTAAAKGTEHSTKIDDVLAARKLAMVTTKPGPIKLDPIKLDPAENESPK